MQKTRRKLWVSAVSRRVQCFTREGRYLGSFGAQGTEPGQFYAPRGIAFNSKGAIFVVDAFNHRIQKFEIVTK